MNTAADMVARYCAELASIAPTLPAAEVPWIQQTRNKARDDFARLGFPTRLQEAWHYTNVGALQRRFFALESTDFSVGQSTIEPLLYPGLDCHRLVFVNGVHAPELSAIGALPKGVELENLATALTRTPEQLEPFLGARGQQTEHAFNALNTALLRDGVCLRLAPNTRLDKPLHLLFLSTGEARENCAQPRNLILAAAGSQAVVLESYHSLDEAACLTNSCSEVILEADAKLQHYKLQEENHQSYHISSLQVQQARDSHFESHLLSLGATLARHELNVDLNGEGARCDLNGLYLGNDRQHVDCHTEIRHMQAGADSRQNYKGILDGRARGVFNGRVYVHPQAQQSNAEQSNHNLLLSANAEADTKPELEIYADDVRCSHGATVGQLDDDMLFYLRSRGLPEDTARGLLILGFARNLLEQMPLKTISARLEQKLIDILSQSHGLKSLI